MKLEPIKIVLNSGRELESCCYIVANANRGAVMYSWCDRTIRNFIRVGEDEARKFFGELPVILVPPVINRDNPDQPHLPMYRFISEFSSAAVSSDMDWSTAIVMWHQNTQFPIISDDVRSAFAEIDWDGLAVDHKMNLGC